MRLKIQLFIFFLLVVQLNKSIAQLRLDEEPKRLYYDRTIRVKKFKDMKDFRDVFHYNKLLLGKNRISGSISYNMSRVLVEDSNHVSHNEIRSAMSFFTRIRFFEFFSLNTSFFLDFNQKASAWWISNYTYSIGRYCWMPRTFSYGYENYIPNRYKDNLSTMGQRFLEGYYFISYSHSLDRLMHKARIDSTTSIKLTYFTRYAINYRDENYKMHGGIFSGKPQVGVSIRATIVWNIYVEGAVYYYGTPWFHKQMPWDPDYTYGFGYYDWRSFRLSLTYGNWAVNRLWNKSKDYPHYGFLDGQFKISLNWIW